jgi:hypothetical protein
VSSDQESISAVWATIMFIYYDKWKSRVGASGPLAVGGRGVGGVESDWVITGDRNLQNVEYALILKSSAAGALRIRCTFR